MSLKQVFAIAAVGLCALSPSASVGSTILTDLELDNVTAGGRLTIVIVSGSDDSDGQVDAYLARGSGKKMNKALARVGAGRLLDLDEFLKLTKVQRALGRLDIRDFPSLWDGMSAKRQRQLENARVVRVTLGDEGADGHVAAAATVKSGLGALTATQPIEVKASQGSRPGSTLVAGGPSASIIAKDGTIVVNSSLASSGVDKFAATLHGSGSISSPGTSASSITP